jgi:hypothetical protein
MAYLFRDKAPVRTCTKQFSKYSAYKPYLASDYNNHCGYTHVLDTLFGGSRTFQIDHIKPESVYPELINDYNNLVYCCSYVHRAKWDDDSPNYLDPCTVDFNEHFERDEEGVIYGKTTQAKYMVERMHLNLARYALAWKVERLENIVNKLRPIAQKNSSFNEIMLSLYEYHWNLCNALRHNL